MFLWSQVQIGDAIYGVSPNDQAGESVFLSSNGAILAIGEPGNDTIENNSGQVSIYENTNGDWIQLGQNLNGTGNGDGFGRSISVSENGTVIAISAPSSDIDFEGSGLVQVFENINGVWTQIGQDLIGGSTFESFGSSVALSADGTIVANRSIRIF